MTEKRIKYWAKTLRRLRAECYEGKGAEPDYLCVSLMKHDGGAEDWVDITINPGNKKHGYKGAYVINDGLLMSEL